MAYTGYKIITYIDVNPKSSSFQQTRTERVSDTTNCGVPSSDWTVIGHYCEVVNNSNTGYYVTQEMDSNVDSPTYGNTRESKVYNTTLCPLTDTNPIWNILENRSYCETKKFPSGLEGNTGRYIVTLVDENKNSATYNQTRTSALTEADWTTAMVSMYGEFPCEGVDTTPSITPISESCVMVECNGKTTTNGQKKIFGLDKNIYSETYLQSVETIVTDTTTCPNGCGGSVDTYVFTFSDSSTTKTTNVVYNDTQETFSIISTKNGSSQAFTASESCNWVTTSINGSTLTVNMVANSGDSRSCTITLTQSGSNNNIILTITQAAKPEDSYVFTWEGGSTIYTWVLDYSGGTYSKGVVSTKNGSAQEWSIESGTATKTSSGITVTLTENTSTTESKDTVITLKQQTSNKTIMITFRQDPKPSDPSNYTFEWTDGTTSKYSYGGRWAAGITYYFNSKKGSENFSNVTIESTEGWDESETRFVPSTGYNSSQGAYYLDMLHPTNTGKTDISYKVTLKQGESNKRIYAEQVAQRIGADEDFFYENSTATTINAVLAPEQQSYSFSLTVISKHLGVDTGFTITSSANWITASSITHQSANQSYTFKWGVSSTSQTERSGTLTLSQNGTTKKLYINVTELPSCTPSTSTCYTNVSNIFASNVKGTATTNTVSWDWSGTRIVTDNGCNTTETPISGSSSTTVTFSTNYGDSARTVSGSYTWNVPKCDGTSGGFTIPYSFIQSRSCHPTTSYCYTNVSDISVEDSEVPATRTANTLTWNYSGTEIVTDEDCNVTERPINGSSSTTLVFPMNRRSSAITVSGTYTWNVDKCDGTSGGFSIPYSFTQKSAREGQVYITWMGNYTEIVRISRLIITLQGSTNRHYFDVASGPIYAGSSNTSIVNVPWSDSRKMSSMQAVYSLGSSSTTYTKYVKLPSGSSTSSNPTFTFSSDYFQGGDSTMFIVSN